MAEARRIRLGELLVDAGLLQPGDLERVLQVQKTARIRLGKLLLREGLVDEGQLTQILSHQLSVPWVSLHHIEFSRQLLNLVPAHVADSHDLVPIYVRHVRGQGQTLYLAMEDPQDEDGLAACRSHSGLPVRPMIASPTEIRRAIQVYYGVAPRQEPALPEPAPAEPPAPEVVEAPPAPAPEEVSPAAEPSPVASQELLVATADSSEARARVADSLATAEPAAAAAGDVAATVPGRARRPVLSFDDEIAPASARAPSIPQPAGRAPRMVALTLLDGTTIQLPARKGKAPAPEAADAPPPSRRPGDPGELTARDLVSALRAVAHGADASEVLGDQVRWEAMFAAILSLLLKKHLIADWEFVEEYRKHSS